MSIKQLSVFLENRPGKLFELTALLAEKGIDMRALSIAETTDFGIARLIVNDAYGAAQVNIEYMYAFLGGKRGQAYMIFRVTNTEIAEKALVERGLKSLTLEEIEET